jgi:cytochrome c oxidase subunit II
MHVISRPIFILWSKHSRARSLPVLLGLLLLPACDGIQSVLDPRGPDAQQIAVMSWIMFAEGALIFLIVMALAAYALFASPNRRAKIGRRDLIIGGGILFPVVMLSALLIYSLTVADAIVGTVEPAALRIEVVGEQWWWRVHYLDSAGKPQVVTANEIHIPVGRPVELSLKSADVIHSFWVPSLAGKVDMIPGHINTLHLKAKQPGVFRGQCAEYCGGPHALMAFYLVAQTPQEFNAWLASERRQAVESRTPFLQQGQMLFLSKECGQKDCCVDCHTIRGTPAEGQKGPDLTHVGSRRSIAAGILPNNAGTLAGWIADSQHIKPENRMPFFDIYSGEELRALAAYLESLK